MTLPLAKNRGGAKGKRAPESAAIFAAMEVATTVIGSQYLAQNFPIAMQALGPEMVKKGKPVEERLQEYSENISLQRGKKADIWSGRLSPLTDFQNLQQNLAQKATEEISTKVKGDVKMGFAISESSQITRGFTEDGKAITKEKRQLFDTLFNSWLAEPKEGPENEKTTLISQGSIIYEGTEHGKILHDEDGNKIKAEPEKVKKLINDKDEGFQAYMQDKLKDTGIQTSVEEKVAVEKPPVIEKVEEKVVTPEAAPEQEEIVPERKGISGP